MVKIQTVIFDIGNVLIDFDFMRMLQQLSDVCGVDIQQIIALYADLGMEYEKGHVSSSQFFHQFEQISQRTIEEEKFWHAFTHIFAEKTEMQKIVQEVKEKGLRTLLLSNTCESHYRFLVQNFKVFEWIDVPILSYEVGARKPDHRIFEAALQAAGCPPEQCFYIDDIVAYVEEARKLGIISSPFTTVELLREDLTRLI